MSWTRFLARIAVIDAAVIAIVVIVNGWRQRLDAATLGEWLIWCGLIAATIGGLAAQGGWSGRESQMSYAASAGRATLAERARLAARDVTHGYRRLFVMLLIGLPLVGLGIALDPRFP